MSNRCHFSLMTMTRKTDLILAPLLQLFAITPLLVGANDPKKIRLHLDLGLKILGFTRIVYPTVEILARISKDSPA